MKNLRALLISAVVFSGLYALYRVWYRLLEKGLLRTKPNSGATPAATGLEYEEIWIPNGKRRLQAWYVPAAPARDIGAAVLILHGVAESISDWVPALAYLSAHGIAAMVFDYSGFGNSGGRATLANLREDVQAAYRAFLGQAGAQARKYALGHSLGTGMLLDGIRAFTPQPDGVILIAGFTSAREAVVGLGAIPAQLTFLIPDVLNNERALTKLGLPLLVVHSRADQLFPASMPERLYAAAPGPKKLVLLDGLRHNDLLEGKEEQYLEHVVEFLSGTQPARSWEG